MRGVGRIATPHALCHFLSQRKWANQEKAINLCREAADQRLAFPKACETEKEPTLCREAADQSLAHPKVGHLRGQAPALATGLRHGFAAVLSPSRPLCLPPLRPSPGTSPGAGYGPAVGTAHPRPSSYLAAQLRPSASPPPSNGPPSDRASCTRTRPRQARRRGRRPRSSQESG